ncbi:uncharacterized protein LOC144370766 [Ictidomys tridecemlineatus]
MQPGARASWRTLLLVFSALGLLLQPCCKGQLLPTVTSWKQESKGSMQVIYLETWRRCGSAALDPKDGKWSCCGLRYPYHRDSQRCCSPRVNTFLVIPKDATKSELEDCRKYSQKF